MRARGSVRRAVTTRSVVTNPEVGLVEKPEEGGQNTLLPAWGHRRQAIYQWLVRGRRRELVAVATNQRLLAVGIVDGGGCGDGGLGVGGCLGLGAAW